jgi:hypothetical protein
LYGVPRWLPLRADPASFTAESNARGGKIAGPAKRSSGALARLLYA